MKRTLTILSGIALTMLLASSATAQRYDSIRPGRKWLDTEGKPIHAHGFQIFEKDGTYYWYGENKEHTHQKMSFISKWLYIFALKNCNKRNLPLLLHLISAAFCSVSQSRVPTLLQR